MDRRRFLALTMCAAASLKRYVAAAANFYSTEFSSEENPLSENGRWINGKVIGLDWQDVQATQGFATFAELNGQGRENYDDATALLSGDWGPNQHVRTVIHRPTIDTNFAQEFEIRLRSTVSAHINSGYEVLSGLQIVRWNGPINDFTVLRDEGPYANVEHGDIFEATIVGNVITVFINGVRVNRAVDDVFTGGQPGIGFFTRNPSPPLFGFSSFRASDSSFGVPPSPPSNLRLS